MDATPSFSLSNSGQKKIIRKMTKLDPEKLKKSGLTSRLFSALTQQKKNASLLAATSSSTLKTPEQIKLPEQKKDKANPTDLPKKEINIIPIEKVKPTDLPKNEAIIETKVIVTQKLAYKEELAKTIINSPILSQNKKIEESITNASISNSPISSQIKKIEESLTKASIKNSPISSQINKIEESLMKASTSTQNQGTPVLTGARRKIRAIPSIVATKKSTQKITSKIETEETLVTKNEEKQKSDREIDKTESILITIETKIVEKLPQMQENVTESIPEEQNQKKLECFAPELQIVEKIVHIIPNVPENQQNNVDSIRMMDENLENLTVTTTVEESMGKLEVHKNEQNKFEAISEKIQEKSESSQNVKIVEKKDEKVKKEEKIEKKTVSVQMQEKSENSQKYQIVEKKDEKIKEEEKMKEPEKKTVSEQIQEKPESSQNVKILEKIDTAKKEDENVKKEPEKKINSVPSIRRRIKATMVALPKGLNSRKPTIKPSLIVIPTTSKEETIVDKKDSEVVVKNTEKSNKDTLELNAKNIEIEPSNIQELIQLEKTDEEAPEILQISVENIIDNEPKIPKSEKISEIILPMSISTPTTNKEETADKIEIIAVLAHDETITKNQISIPKVTEDAIYLPLSTSELNEAELCTVTSEIETNFDDNMIEEMELEPMIPPSATVSKDPNKKVEILSEVILPEKSFDIKNYLQSGVQQSLADRIRSKNRFIANKILKEQATAEEIILVEPSSSTSQAEIIEYEISPPKQATTIFTTFTHASSYSHVASTSVPPSQMIWSTSPQPEINLRSNYGQIYLTPPIPVLDRPIVYHNYSANSNSPKPLIINLPSDQKRTTIFLAKPAGYIQNNQFVRNLPKSTSKAPLQQTILASTDKSVPSIVIDRSFVENDSNPSPTQLNPVLKEPPQPDSKTVKEALARMIKARMNNNAVKKQVKPVASCSPPKKAFMKQYNEQNKAAFVQKVDVAYKLKGGELKTIMKADEEGFLGYNESSIDNERFISNEKVKIIRRSISSQEKDQSSSDSDDVHDNYDADLSDDESDAIQNVQLSRQPRIRTRTFTIDEAEPNPYLPTLDDFQEEANENESIENKEFPKNQDENIETRSPSPKRRTTSSYSVSPNRNDSKANDSEPNSEDHYTDIGAYTSSSDNDDEEEEKTENEHEKEQLIQRILEAEQLRIEKNNESDSESESFSDDEASLAREILKVLKQENIDSDVSYEDIDINQNDESLEECDMKKGSTNKAHEVLISQEETISDDDSNKSKGIECATKESVSENNTVEQLENPLADDEKSSKKVEITFKQDNKIIFDTKESVSENSTVEQLENPLADDEKSSEKVEITFKQGKPVEEEILPDNESAECPSDKEEIQDFEIFEEKHIEEKITIIEQNNSEEQDFEEDFIYDQPDYSSQSEPEENVQEVDKIEQVPEEPKENVLELNVEEMDEEPEENVSELDVEIVEIEEGSEENNPEPDVEVVEIEEVSEKSWTELEVQLVEVETESVENVLEVVELEKVQQSPNHVSEVVLDVVELEEEPEENISELNVEVVEVEIEPEENVQQVELDVVELEKVPEENISELNVEVVEIEIEPEENVPQVELAAIELEKEPPKDCVERNVDIVEMDKAPVPEESLVEWDLVESENTPTEISIIMTIDEDQESNEVNYYDRFESPEPLDEYLDSNEIADQKTTDEICDQTTTHENDTFDDVLVLELDNNLPLSTISCMESTIETSNKNDVEQRQNTEKTSKNSGKITKKKSFNKKRQKMNSEQEISDKFSELNRLSLENSDSRLIQNDNTIDEVIVIESTENCVNTASKRTKKASTKPKTPVDKKKEARKSIKTPKTSTKVSLEENETGVVPINIGTENNVIDVSTPTLPQEEHTISEVTSTPLPFESPATTSTQKKRGRKPKNATSTPSRKESETIKRVQKCLAESEGMGLNFLNQPTRKRGRPRKDGSDPKQKSIDSFFVASDSNKKQKKRKGNELFDNAKTKKSKKGDIFDEDPVFFKCGNCGLNVLKSNWASHVIQHNGLTWVEGVEPGFDLTNENVIQNVMMRYQKFFKQPFVTCEKCGVVKKSAIGLVSHQKFCGLTPEEIENTKVECQHCHKKVLPVSIGVHIQNHCPALKKQQFEEEIQRIAENQPEEEEEIVDENGKIKRKARKRAEAKIKTIVDNLQSIEEMIMIISRTNLTHGVMQGWNAQFRRARAAKCVFHACDFVSENEIILRNHHAECPHGDTALFQCSLCKYQSENKDSVIKHIKIYHVTLRQQYEPSDSDASVGSESSDSDGSSGVEEIDDNDSNAEDGHSDNGMKEERRSRSHRKSHKKHRRKKLKMSVNFCKTSRDQFAERCDVYREMILDEYIVIRNFKPEYHIYSVKLMTAFVENNYINEFLYPDLMPKECESLQDIKSYIPKQTKSIKFVHRLSNVYDETVKACSFQEKWQQMDAFSSDLLNQEGLIYSGGPVTAMDWLPFQNNEDSKREQILATVSKFDFDKYFIAKSREKIKCLIQIWSCGILSNKRPKEAEPPTLLYSIACDYGPIWDIKFCPSGCYQSSDDENSSNCDRLGLLAATSADGDVYIYALDKKFEQKITNQYRIIMVKPSLVLTLNLNATLCNYESASAVKLSWSKAIGHNIIAAGFSNGCVAVWNLTVKSSLLQGTKNGIVALLPTRKLFIPGTVITSLAVHHVDDSRYLMVSSSDRKVRIYDLKTDFIPREISNATTKSKISAAIWPTLWPLTIFACDEGYALDCCTITIHQHREIGTRMSPMYTISSNVTDLDVNDWTNNVLASTDGGDVLATNSMQFLHLVGRKKSSEYKLALSYTNLVSLEEKSSSSSTDFSNLFKNYGVVFTDTDKVPLPTLAALKWRKKLRRADVTLYPGNKVNKVCWNPNQFSNQYYAIGYQSGFIRIKSIKKC